MRFWRTISAVALIGLVPAAMAMADDDSGSGGKGGGTGPSLVCEKNTETELVFPLVLCKEMQESTNTGVGNQFPWENSTFFFSSFRNQFLFPGSTVAALDALSIESIHARASSFSAGSTNVYTTSGGRDSTITVTQGLDTSLVTTFELNTDTTATAFGEISSAGGDIVIESFTGDNGSILHDCTSCPGTPGGLGTRNAWIDVITPSDAQNLLVDSINFVGTGNSGGTIWDVTSTDCSEVQRAFGSGSFANSQHLTNALGVDGFSFVWVFKGLGLPPPASVQQQIADVIRLLLTPEGLRCSGLDLTGMEDPDDPSLIVSNGKIEDDPVAFPAGADLDPIMPQVTTGGEITGDERKDGRRSAGWNP